MSNLGKVFLGMSILFSLVAAGLGFMVAKKKTQYSEQLAAVESSLRSMPLVTYQGDYLTNTSEPAATLSKAGAAAKKMKEELADAQTKATEATTKLADSQAEVQKLTTEVTSTKRELDTNTKQLAEAQQKVTTLDGQLKQINDQLGGRKIDAILSQLSDSEEKSKVLAAEKKILEDSYAKSQADLNKMMELEQLRKQRIAPIDLNGKIVAINKSWNFVVLDVGKDNKLTEGVDLTVYRGEELVGKVRTVSVEDNTAIADILPDWEKGDLEVGDRVLF